MMRFCLIVSCIFLCGDLGAQKLLKTEILDKIDLVSYPARNPSPVIKLSILGKEFSSFKKIEEYKSVQVLRIQNCSFKDLIIDLNKFPVLQDIYISDCNFERFEIIGNPVNLIKICIYENHFDNFNFLSSLTSLKEFYTSDTISLEIESLTENLLKLSNINSIGIYDGNIKYLPKTFGQFKELDYLVLGNIKKNVDLFSMFNVLRKINIRSLSLSGGDFDSLPSNTGELKSLVNFYLDGTSIKTLPQSISGLSSLTHLSASMSELNSLPESMAQMKSLTILGLIPAKFTSIPQVLYKMTWLKEVEIGNEEWWPTDEELEPLRKALKKTKVN